MTDDQAEGGAADAPEFSPSVQEFVDSVRTAAREADLCLKGGNKSAGRRARKESGVDAREQTVEGPENLHFVPGPVLAQGDIRELLHGSGLGEWRECMGIEPTGPAVHGTHRL